MLFGELYTTPPPLSETAFAEWNHLEADLRSTNTAYSGSDVDTGKVGHGGNDVSA